MNRTPKRFGKAPASVVSAKAGSDSSHGSAMVTPAPRRTVRREMRLADFFVRSDILFTFLFWGIRLRRLFRNCGLVTIVSISGAETVAVRGRRFALHLLDRRARRTACSDRPSAYASSLRLRLSRNSFWRCSRMYACTPSTPSPCRRRGKRPASRPAVPPRSLSRAFADRAVAFERQAERIESRVAGGAARVLAVLRQHVAQRQIRTSLRPAAARERWAAAAESLRRARAAPPSSRASRGWSAARASSASGKRPSAAGRRDRTCSASSTRTQWSRRRRLRAFRSASRAPDSRMCSSPYSRSRTEPVVADHVLDEPDRLLEHRLAQVVVEAGEALAVDGIVLLEAAEVQPVAGELERRGRCARSSFSMRRACAIRTSGFCRSPAAAWARNSSSGMLDQRK